ncbi:energy transducer TonB [Hymenobacter artigasi]|uniref:TonB family protein n=1 Tax=Hymenobacter artigasi TaxID=2719616 RepID=A0ABX1HCU9_9BACT|nr:energy transducer TonB [Hymenobacter artigasi]NKI88044.1 TonB family protein [Hymenobacter artigasi]
MPPADSPFARLPAPGPHPAPAELRAYAAGTLPPAEEHRLEAHTLDCERCADLLTGFSMSDPATTDQAVAELRTRLQARIGTGEPVPVAGGWAWPRIAATAAVLGIVAGGIWTWEQHETIPPAATARLETAATAPPAAPAARPNPTPEPMAPAPTTAPATEVAAASIPPPPTSKTTDYAAVRPSRSQRRALLGQPASRAMNAAGTDAMMMADEASAPEAEAKAAASVAAAPVGYTAETASTLAETTSADTLANAKAARTSRTLAAKAKTMAANQLTGNTAGASVINTPMPATPTFQPAPVGGTPALRSYLHREAAAFEPEEGERPLNGTVRLRFMVGADGKISNLKVVGSLRADYDNEALRMVCEGPTWQPGIAGGRRADLPMELAITF